MDRITDDVAGASEELTAIVSSMAARLDELGARNARLEAEVAALRRANEFAPASPARARAAEASAVAEDEGSRRRALSRRQLIGLAGAGAAGAGLAVGASVLGAKPAAAAASTDGDVHLGGSESDNNSGDIYTGLSSSNPGPTLFVTKSTGSGSGIEAVGNPAVQGFSFVGSTSPGLIGTASGGSGGTGPGPAAQGVGVRGEVLVGGGHTPVATTSGVVGSNEGLGTGVLATSAMGVGVSAQGATAPLLLVPASSAGAPTSGAHAKGEVYVDSAGVLFLCTAAGSPGAWVRAITSGVDAVSSAGPGVQVNQAGAGSGVVGNVTNTASIAAAVYGISNAPGQAVKGYQSGTGIAVFGQIANTANSNPAVYANTNGKGAGLQANQAGTGYGLLSSISNTANSVAAVRGVTTGTGPGVQGVNTSAGGRGGVFQGGSSGAAIQLVPSTVTGHPTAGQRGDLYVDGGGVLWFCTTSGNPATWKTVQVT